MSPRNNTPFKYSRFISNCYENDDDYDDYDDTIRQYENANVWDSLSQYQHELLDQVLDSFYANNAPDFPHIDCDYDHESDSDMSLEDDSFYDGMPPLEYCFLGDVPPLEFDE